MKLERITVKGIKGYVAKELNLTNRYHDFEDLITKAPDELDIKREELTFAIKEMDRHNHNIADFGINRNFICTSLG